MRVYQLFVRNYSQQGTFEEVTKSVKKIKDLGIDCIYLLPIHPIGVKDKKGDLGSPYSIRDYKQIDPRHGTFEDFKKLVKSVHDEGMKIIMDAVINHTAKDNELVTTHPEWYYTVDGKISAKVKEWYDIVDLDYECKDKDNLITYIIDVFKFWLNLGVDGFRCDVASKIPEHVWEKCIIECKGQYNKSIWIAESFHLKFSENNHNVLSENALLKHFDLTYDYSLWKLFNSVVKGYAELEYYLDHIRLQLCNNKGRYLRFLENHDTQRFLSNADTKTTQAWLGFFNMLPDSIMIYNGFEYCNKSTPSLFQKDIIQKNENNMLPLLQNIMGIKQYTNQLPVTSDVYILKIKPLTVVVYDKETTRGLYGIFFVRNENNTNGKIFDVELNDGVYQDIISAKNFVLKSKTLQISNNDIGCIVLQFKQKQRMRSYKSNLF